jgi:Tfp pilus assembly protein PilV
MRRHAFTLVEVMLALALLACGLLGLAAAAGTAARLSGEGARAARALMLARARVEALTAGGCPEAAADGSDSDPAALIDEHWSITPRGVLAIVRDSVSHGRDGERLAIVLEGVVVC